MWGGNSNKGENATEEHRRETHPSSAPSVEENSEQYGGRKFCEGGQRECHENVRVQKFQVPDVAVEHPHHQQPGNKAAETRINRRFVTNYSTLSKLRFHYDVSQC